MKTKNLKFLLILLLGATFFTACETDEPTTKGATLTLATGDGYVVESAEVDTDAAFTVRLSGTSNDVDMNTLTIFEGSDVVNLSRIQYDDTPASANPKLLLGDDVNSFTYDISIEAHSDVSTKTYTFEVKDVDGEVANLSVLINTVYPGTPVTLHEGVLLNSSGPVGTGGLDLDNGTGTGSNDIEAEIKDLGGAPDWLQQISGVNGSVISYVIAGQNNVPEGFTFSSVNYKEEIALLATVGIPVTESEPIVIGDMFTVVNGDNTYFIIVKEINVTPTTGDNTDNYVFDIKK